MLESHVTTPGFGVGILMQSEPTDLDRLWYEAEFDDAIKAQIVLRETYETVFELFDHDGQGYDNPLAIVAMHDKEDTATYSRLYGELRRFAMEDDVQDMWGLNLVELLSLPKDVVDEIYRLTREIREQKNAEGTSLSRRFMRESKGKGLV